MNKSKRKGTSFESAVVEYLRSRGMKVERRALRGSKDCGDIAGIPDWVLELKATRELDIGGALREAEDEAFNDSASYFAAVLKRRRAKIRDSYVVMPLWEWVEMYQQIHGAPAGGSVEREEAS